jgi:hypothetical protein
MNGISVVPAFITKNGNIFSITPKHPQKKWIEYYSSVFNTLELNVTFAGMGAINMHCR